MPAYAFRCLDCRRRFDIFLTYQEYGQKPVACPHCGSANVRRRLTRVRVLRADDSRAESLTDDLPDLDGLEDDPRALGRAMRKMGKDMGEDASNGNQAGVREPFASNPCPPVLNLCPGDAIEGSRLKRG